MENIDIITIVLCVLAVTGAAIFVAMNALADYFDKSIKDLRSEIADAIECDFRNHEDLHHAPDDHDDDEALPPPSYAEYCRATEAMGDLIASLRSEGQYGPSYHAEMLLAALVADARRTYPEQKS